MKKENETKIDNLNRQGEKGAALISVLLISLLLLVASVGLLLESSMNTANVSDATAEQQAYNAAESGIQSALNVFRGNVAPNPLIVPSKPATDKANTIDFLKALQLNSSNLDSDSSTVARLSRWMGYNYTPVGSSNPDRIAMGEGAYDPYTGYAYSVTVKDPDNTGLVISYSTSGSIEGAGSSKTFGSGLNQATITYISKNAPGLNVSSGLATTDFGKFQISILGTGATIASDVRFEILVNMSQPYSATKVIRGFIKAGTISNNSVGTVKFDFDSQNMNLMGSQITLNSDPLTPIAPTLTTPGVTVIAGSMTPAEPIRVIVRSIGYGPRGARKELEAVIQKNFFNGLSAPASLTLIGSTSGFHFDAGASNNVTYSGDDVVSNVIIPPIGTSNDTNINSVNANLAGSGNKANLVGVPANVNVEMPFWLQSAANLDAIIQSLRNVSKSSGRYFASGQTPPNVGNNANATGITFADGNLELQGSGGGILVVTGNLTLKGNFDFNGLIIVTGSGGVQRAGGGNGTLQGNTVVAPYNPNNVGAGFSGPKYDISGGGTSTLTYNSSSIANGLTAVSNFVLGVAEK